MEIILWIIFGALIGWVASIVMKTDADQDVILNVVIGIVGALVGGFVMNSFGQTGISGFNLYSFLVALLGAIILISIVRLFRR